MKVLRFPVFVGILGASLVSGCAASRLGAPVGEAAVDPTTLQNEIASSTTPATPLQVNFGWTLVEGGSRVNGRGVVRVEATERARLDLFGPRGETYLIAALVDEQYRLPPGAVDTATLPSPSLLWSAVGVLKPPAGAQLESATATDTSAELRYRTPNGEIFAYTFSRDPASGSYALTRLERAAGRGVIESINVDRLEDGTLSRTRYRNWSEYRDLTLDIEELRESPTFPTEIWSPDAAR